MRKLLSKHITAVALSAALFLAASPCTMTAQAAGTRFADVPNGAWYILPLSLMWLRTVSLQAMEMELFLLREV